MRVCSFKDMPGCGRLRVYVYLMTGCLLMTLDLSSASRLVEIQITEGAVVVFLLPAYATCGLYYLRDQQDSSVVTVRGPTNAVVSPVYKHRGTIRFHGNGTLSFSLHETSWRDEGTYIVAPRDQGAPPNCTCYYALSLYRESGIAFWQKWGSWTDCDVSCGPGIRIRTRECSQSIGCHHGDEREVARCAREVICTEWIWMDWTHWTVCDVTCGTGQRSRSRQCADRVSGQRGEYCTGRAVDGARCRGEDCQAAAVWTDWSPWSTCSGTCGPGNQYRNRTCRSTVAMAPAPDSAIKCDGLAAETQSCSEGTCPGRETNAVDTSPTVLVLVSTPSQDETRQETSEQFVPVPMSAVVGGGAGLLIIVLLVVIVCLVCRLKRRRKNVGITTIYSPRQQKMKITDMNRKSSDISATQMSGTHVYAEIDDYYLSDDFSSCNDYVPLPPTLPRSPSMTEPSYLNLPSASGVRAKGMTSGPDKPTQHGSQSNDGYEVPVTRRYVH